MGSKYRPSIKDVKANQRFHQNAKRAAAAGPAKASLFMTSNSVRPTPKAVGTGATPSERPKQE